MKMKNILVLIIIVITSIFLYSCKFTEKNKYEKTFFSMDAPVNLTVYSENGIKVIAEAENRINELDNLFSNTDEESEIYKLNTLAGKDFIYLSPETAEIIDLSKFYAVKTDGTFNPVLGPIVNLWGISSGKTEIPLDSEINEKLVYCNINDLKKNDSGQFRLDKTGMLIDLGAIGKGYAANEVAKILQNYNVKSALVSIGASSVVAFGSKPDSTDWIIGLKDVDNTQDRYYGIINVKDKNISTSGDYERFFEKDGKRFHHIFNPETGYPADKGLRAVTVVSDNGILADAYSTALFVMGLNKAVEFQKNNKDDFEAILVTNEKEVICTDGIKQCFKFTGENSGYTYET